MVFVAGPKGCMHVYVCMDVHAFVVCVFMYLCADRGERSVLGSLVSMPCRICVEIIGWVSLSIGVGRWQSMLIFTWRMERTSASSR